MKAPAPAGPTAGPLPPCLSLPLAGGNALVSAWLARWGSKAPEKPYYERETSLVADFDPVAHDEAYRKTKLDPGYVFLNGRSMVDLLRISLELHAKLGSLGGIQYLIDRLSACKEPISHPRLHAAFEATIVRRGTITAAAFELNADRRIVSWGDAKLRSLDDFGADDRLALINLFSGDMVWVQWVKKQQAFAQLDPFEQVRLRLDLCDLRDTGRRTRERVEKLVEGTETTRQFDAAALRGLLVADAARDVPLSGGWGPTARWFVRTGELAAVQPGELSASTAKDVQQGTVGDCWFVSAAGAMAASDPAAVERMIKKNADGTYDVTLQLLDAKGKRNPRTVRVSAELPGAPGGVQHGARGPDLWVALLEKAFAAVYGGYDMLGGGSSGQAFGDLMGGTSTSVDLATTGEAGFEQIATALAAKRPVVAATPHALKVLPENKDDQSMAEWNRGLQRRLILDRRKELGIPEGGHQWMVTSADQSARKITVRNPHGGAAPEITVGAAEFVRLWSSADIGSPAAPRP